MTETWQKYTITALLGCVAGLAAVYGNTTINNAYRLSSVEAYQASTVESLRRIELKVDQLSQVKH